jgi:hypothetical protein
MPDRFLRVRKFPADGIHLHRWLEKSCFCLEVNVHQMMHSGRQLLPIQFHYTLTECVLFHQGSVPGGMFPFIFPHSLHQEASRILLCHKPAVGTVVIVPAGACHDSLVFSLSLIPEKVLAVAASVIVFKNLVNQISSGPGFQINILQGFLPF